MTSFVALLAVDGRAIHAPRRTTTHFVVQSLVRPTDSTLYHFHFYIFIVIVGTGTHWHTTHSATVPNTGH
jgi:hypothetical protein